MPPCNLSCTKYFLLQTMNKKLLRHCCANEWTRCNVKSLKQVISCFINQFGLCFLSKYIKIDKFISVLKVSRVCFMAQMLNHHNSAFMVLTWTFWGFWSFKKLFLTFGWKKSGVEVGELNMWVNLKQTSFIK